MAEELSHLLPISELPADHLGRYHSRLSLELQKRVTTFKFDTKKTTSDVKSAVKLALDDNKRLLNSSASHDQIVEPDEALKKKVGAMVRTDQFVSRYLSLFQIAAEGNYEPLVQLILTFARRLASHTSDTTEAATLLLQEARAALTSPDNDALWAAVYDMVRSEINDSGSEVAA